MSCDKKACIKTLEKTTRFLCDIWGSDKVLRALGTWRDATST